MKTIIKDQHVDSDVASPSSGSEDTEHQSSSFPSSIQFSLSDARFALSYVKHKIEQRDASFGCDDGCEIQTALKHHRRISNAESRFDGFRTQSSICPSQSDTGFNSFRTQSSSGSSGTCSTDTSAKTYSSFRRPERRVVRHRMDLLEDGRGAFNIYSSEVDFVENPVSISMIEDASDDASSSDVDLVERPVSISRIEDAAATVVPASDGDRRRARCPSTVRFPSLPPKRPPPLRMHRTAATRGLVPERCSESFPPHQDVDDLSDVTHVEKANSLPWVALDFNDSKNCFGF